MFASPFCACAERRRPCLFYTLDCYEQGNKISLRTFKIPCSKYGNLWFSFLPCSSYSAIIRGHRNWTSTVALLLGLVFFESMRLNNSSMHLFLNSKSMYTKKFLNRITAVASCMNQRKRILELTEARMFVWQFGPGMGSDRHVELYIIKYWPFLANLHN